MARRILTFSRVSPVVGVVILLACDLGTDPRGTRDEVRFASIAAGTGLSCGIALDGATYCWGNNRWGALGGGPNVALGNFYGPILVSGGHSFGSLQPGQLHTCGIESSGQLSCWGRNVEGQLGTGTTAGPETCGSTACASAPIAVVTGGQFRSLSLGFRHTCGVDGAGQIHCWGDNSFGQLGIGFAGDGTSAPTAVANDGVEYVSVTAGQYHTCALSVGGEIYCWGQNAHGESGPLGGTVCPVNDIVRHCTPSPTRVGSGVGFTEVRAGGTHTCGLAASGEVYCWGHNGAGQLGVSPLVTARRCADAGLGESCSTTPLRVETTISFAAISAGGAHTCGLDSESQAYCWGGNLIGQLGNCNVGQKFSAEPSLVCGESRFVQIAAGGGHSCGVTSDGTGYCWGDNDGGALGSKSRTAFGPVPVAGVSR